MSAEEAVTAWLASGMPMSLHETTRHREVLDAESCSEGVESGNKLVQRGKSAGTISLARKRPTQLGSPPVRRCHSTRPNGKGGVLDAESCSEGVDGSTEFALWLGG